MRGLPRAMYAGDLPIAGVRIPCAVLSNGQRVLTQEGFLEALGRSKKAGGHQIGQVDNLPPFLAAKNLQPYITADLVRSTTPVPYMPLRSGGKYAVGYTAEALPAVCRAFLQARRDGALHSSQVHIADQAEVLLGGLATVGIIALVDEATGFEKVRRRNALNKVLEQYIAKELMSWTKRFPDEFYEQMFRLKEWAFNEETFSKRPGFAGTLTRKLIYEKLPDGVLEELLQKNPSDGSGRRKHKHHQWLTPGIGHPALQKQVTEVTLLMRLSDSWTGFLSQFARAYPTEGQQQYLNVDDEELLATH